LFGCAGQLPRPCAPRQLWSAPSPRRCPANRPAPQGQVPSRRVRSAHPRTSRLSTLLYLRRNVRAALPHAPERARDIQLTGTSAPRRSPGNWSATATDCRQVAPLAEGDLWTWTRRLHQPEQDRADEVTGYDVPESEREPKTGEKRGSNVPGAGRSVKPPPAHPRATTTDKDVQRSAGVTPNRP
jgi:hypothetical protein